VGTAAAAAASCDCENDRGPGGNEPAPPPLSLSRKFVGLVNIHEASSRAFANRSRVIRCRRARPFVTSL